jgi:ornithine decarboxylase
MEIYNNLLSVVSNRHLELAQHIFRPHAIETAAHFFLENFQGKILYAVKAQPEPYVLSTLYNAGITDFDVASLAEVELISKLFPDARLFFMHPVKSRHSIAVSYHDYGVRDFSLDSAYELNKILEETNYPSDLNLYIRLSVSNSYSKLDLSTKFGIDIDEAISLLKVARKHAVKLGVSFHVGSQCMNPQAYKQAINLIAVLLEKANTPVNIINVGGGFPSIYPGMVPPPLKEYFDVIHEAFYDLKQDEPMELVCEPGRALVAESGGVIVRVERRKDEFLYINDGTYGSLFDAGTPNFVFPVRIIREASSLSKSFSPFSFFGPTCDSLDFMKGPFMLPSDIREGDYFEIGQLGAYSRSLTTNFNGFSPADKVIVLKDQPAMSMYSQELFNNYPKKLAA